LVDYFYGAEVGASVHYVIGYALFSAWLACFFYIYSKRQTPHAKIVSLRKKYTRHEYELMIESQKEVGIHRRMFYMIWEVTFNRTLFI